MAVGDVDSRIKNAKFIGVTGFAQSGKDETVKILESIGFKRISLADPVRQGVYNINPIVFVEEFLATELGLFSHCMFTTPICISEDEIESGVLYRLRYVVDALGWEEAKKIPEVRRLLQYYGTEGARKIFGDTIWTDTADKYIKENNINKVAVSDVRFPNELEWVRNKKDNLMIKIKRPGVGPINNHVSDLGILDELCDIIIDNDGTINELERKILKIDAM